MKQKSAPKAGKNAKHCAYQPCHEVHSVSMASHQSTPRRRTPKLGKHSSGQARVTIDGKTFYCGRWGSVEAQRRYAELLRQWEQADGRPLHTAPNAVQAALSVRDLFAAFREYVVATGRYEKNGEPTSQRAMFGVIERQLGAFAGHLPVHKMTGISNIA